MQVNAGDGRLHQSHRRNLTKALVSLLALSLAPIAATASTVAPDCPLGNEAYSVDSPLIDILLDPAATAALRAEPGFARFLDGAQPMLLHTEAPSFGAIVSPRFLIGWAQLSADVLPAIDRRLRALPVTRADRARRCARYDDDVPRFDLPGDRPAILVFEKMTGFRDGPSVDAAHAALAALAARNGWTMVFTDRGGVMRPALLKQFSVVVWNNVSGDVLTVAQRAAFRNWVERGGGFVGIHGSGGDYVAFWPWYLDELVGARFLGHPMAPQFQAATLSLSDWGRAIAPGVPASWSMKDEWYSFVANPRASGAQVVATLDESTYTPGEGLAMGADHPIAWTRTPGKGRAFYTAIGHLPTAYADPQALELLRAGLRWAGRLPPAKGSDENRSEK